jgi:hypothetical protein
MSVKIKITAGNKARRKLNANARALVCNSPSFILIIKKLITSCSGTPSKPGSFKIFEKAIICLNGQIE